jgi:hypothetical protein
MAAISTGPFGPASVAAGPLPGPNLGKGACIQPCRASPEAHGQLVRADKWLTYAVLTRRTELHASLDSKTANAGIMVSSVRVCTLVWGSRCARAHLGCGIRLPQSSVVVMLTDGATRCRDRTVRTSDRSPIMGTYIAGRISSCESLRSRRRSASAQRPTPRRRLAIA